MANEVASVTQDRLPDDDYDKSTPELDHDAILLRIKEWWKEDNPTCKAFHREAQEAFEFKAGDGGQWSREDRDTLDANKRVILEFNRVEPVINAVVGAEITNRQEVRYLPRQVGDAAVNEVLTEAARWFRDECDAEHEESQAFADAVTCGMGWTETRLDYEENPDGAPEIKRRDPTEMFWDASARQANLTDARRIYRVRREVPLEEAKALAPDFEDEDYDATWAATETEEENPYVVNRPQSEPRHETTEGQKQRTVTLVQVQWWERQDYYRAMAINPMTGEQRIEDLEEEQHFTAQQRAQELNVPYRAVKQTRKCYYQAFVGAKVLSCDKVVAPSGKHAAAFNFVPMTGYLDRKKGYWYGLVRGMKGPQQFANKWLTTTVEIMARNAKGGLMYEEGSVKDIDDFEKDWAKPGANAVFNNGAVSGGRVQPKPAGAFPSDFMQMTQFAISSIRDCTGVSAELLGMAETDQAASLEYQRRQSSTTILAPLFDSLRRYRRIEGRVLLFLITEYLSDNRLIRITGEVGEQYVPLTKQPGVVEYDVIVDDAPSSPAQKEMVWQSMVQMTPLITQLQPPPDALMALLEYSPLPASVVSKIKAAVQKAQENPAPNPEQQKVEAQQQQLAAEMQATQQKNAMEMQATQQKNSLDLEKSGQEMQFKARSQEMEFEHKERMANLEYEIEARKAAQELQVATQKMDLQERQIQLKAREQGVRVKKESDGEAETLMQGLNELGKLHATTAEALNRPRKRTLYRDGKPTKTFSVDEAH